jgi:hypothetical protein
MPSTNLVARRALYVTFQVVNRFALILAFWMTVILSDTAAAESGSGVREQLAGLKMVNYYAAHAAHGNFWPGWRPTEIDQDFATIARMHANTVRIAIPPGTFGYPQPSKLMLDRLREFVDLADKHGLRTKLALFAFFGKYEDIGGSSEWAEALLRDFKDDHRIACIDLYRDQRQKPRRSLGCADAASHPELGSIPQPYQQWRPERFATLNTLGPSRRMRRLDFEVHFAVAALTGF